MFAEVEKKKFIQSCVAKALAGKKTVEKPQFISLLGAKGSGKTTLGRKLENTVLVSADDIIGDYFKVHGADARSCVYGDEERRFFTQAVNAVFVAAIRNKFNIAYDTGLTDNTEELIRRMQKKGYESCIKAILADDIAAQLNVVERKLDFDKKFTAYKNGEAPYPDGLNPTMVDMKLAAKSATDTAQFLMNTAEHFEAYEYGADAPAYDSRTAKQPFAEYLADFCRRLPEPKVYKSRIARLYLQANKQKNHQISRGLSELHQELFKQKIASGPVQRRGAVCRGGI